MNCCRNVQFQPSTEIALKVNLNRWTISRVILRIFKEYYTEGMHPAKFMQEFVITTALKPFNVR